MISPLCDGFKNSAIFVDVLDHHVILVIHKMLVLVRQLLPHMLSVFSVDKQAHRCVQDVTVEVVGHLDGE